MPPRFIATYTIGNSDTSDAKRRVGWDIERIGWDGFVHRHIARDLRDGFAAIELHNPFGTLANEEMLATQFLDAKRAGLDWLTDGFTEAWSPVVKAGVEVISYPGSLILSDRLNQLAVSGGPRFNNEIMESFRPMCEAGCSLGIDSHHKMPVKHWAHDAFKRVLTWSRIANPKARGYVETYPHKTDAPWFLKPSHAVMANLGVWVMATNDYLRCEYLGQPLPDWPLLPLPVGHEVIVHITGNPSPGVGVPIAEWMPALIRHHVSRGRSIAVPPSDLRALGMKPADFLGAVS